MSKSRREHKSLSHNRKARRFQSEKLQKRVKLGQERSQGKRNSILKSDIDINSWYPKDGSHIIDVIPYIAGKHDPLVEKGDPTYTFECWVHTRIGPNSDKVFLCMQEMYGEPCPICKHRQQLRKEGAEEASWKKLFPKRRNLYNIICYDKDEEKKGVQVWDISYHYFEKQVLAIAKKPSRSGGKEKLINFANPANGKSVSFTIEPAKSKNDYPAYIGHSFDDRDYEIDDTLLDSAITLDEAVTRPKYKDVETAYWNESKKSKNEDEDNKDENGDENNKELADLVEEVEDLDGMDELEDFIDENDLDIRIKKKDDEDDVKDKIIDALEEKFDGAKVDDDDDDDNNAPF
jgi:hypothetical protein